jgi:dolichyl-phosphate-mannose-protein mannosyltransferase
MATDTAFVSGADYDAQATRRRNVPSTPPNGYAAKSVELDEKKKRVKKVTMPLLALASQTLLQNQSLTFLDVQGEESLLQTLDEWEPLIAPIVFTILAFATRLFKIGLSPIVTWDEAQ